MTYFYVEKFFFINIPPIPLYFTRPRPTLPTVYPHHWPVTSTWLSQFKNKLYIKILKFNYLLVFMFIYCSFYEHFGFILISFLLIMGEARCNKEHKGLIKI